MLIREHFPNLATWNVQFVGTDLSEDVLARARAGKFSQIEINRGLPAPLLLKYFERDGMTWQITARSAFDGNVYEAEFDRTLARAAADGRRVSAQCADLFFAGHQA